MSKQYPYFISLDEAVNICNEYQIKLSTETISISNNSAFFFSRELAKCEGIPGGISTGAVIAAAIEIHERKEMQNHCSVIIIPSFAERYLSTELFNES